MRARSAVSSVATYLPSGPSPADHQLHFRNVYEPLLDKSPFHFARLHHRLEAITAAQLATAFTERRHRVDHHAHAGHTAEMVPYGCRDDAAPLPRSLTPL